MTDEQSDDQHLRYVDIGEFIPAAWHDQQVRVSSYRAYRLPRADLLRLALGPNVAVSLLSEFIFVLGLRWQRRTKRVAALPGLATLASPGPRRSAMPYSVKTARFSCC
jgi:hypothetical protein